MINQRINSERGYYKRAVGVFKRREDLEDVLRRLKDDGYNMERVSLIARHVEDVEGADDVTDRAGNEAEEGAGIGATTGTVLGGIGGFLIGVGVLAIPGVGPILAAGAEINALASTLAGAGIGAATGGIIGALIGLGIPEDQAKVYDKRVKAGQYLLMVSGTETEIRRVEAIMRDRHVEEFNIYDVPDSAQTHAASDRQTVASTTQREQRATRDDSKAIDVDRDGEQEVLIVDNRNEVQRRTH